MSIVLFLLLLLNFVISWFNAWSVGRGWIETKAMGGLARFMAWCGAIMSASGFTWCFLIILVFLNSLLPEAWRLPAKYSEGMMRLGYLAIILPILGTGLAITIQSWTYFWRERTFKNGAIAGWNTFADIYNMYTAVRVIPESLSFLGNLFGSEDDEDSDIKSKLLWIMVVLVVLAILGGILMTTTIIRATARSQARQQSSRAKQSGADHRSWREQPA